MKRFKSLLLALTLAAAVPVHSQEDFLTGDKRLACEAILCLAATGGKPDECQASLRKYFSIVVKRHGSFSPGRTLQARKNFLKLCPDASNNVINQVNTSESGSIYNYPFSQIPGGITFYQLHVLADLLNAFDLDFHEFDTATIRQILAQLSPQGGNTAQLTDQDVETIWQYLILYGTFNTARRNL